MDPTPPPMFAKNLEKGFRGMFKKGPIDTDPPKSTVPPIPTYKLHTIEVVEHPISRRRHMDHYRVARNACRGPDFKPPSTRRTQDQDFAECNILSELLRRQAAEWPRDPNGQVVKKLPPGRVVGNGLALWGATREDFFTFAFNPKNSGSNFAHLNATSSVLLEWLKQEGNLEDRKFAMKQILQAEKEPLPREILPCDIGYLMEVDEMRPEAIKKLMAEQLGSSRPKYKLQERLPFRLLPETLLVYAFDDVLNVGQDQDHKDPQSEKCSPRRYKLCLSEETRAAIAKEREAIQTTKPEPEGLKFVLSQTKPTKTPQEVPQAVFASFPPRPQPLLSVPEAKIFVSSNGKMGEGNHSMVYQMMWDIPSATVLKPHVCTFCAHDAVLAGLQSAMPYIKVDESQAITHQIKQLLIAAAKEYPLKGNMWLEDCAPEDVLLIVEDEGSEKRKTPKYREATQTTKEVYEGPMQTLPLDVEWILPGRFCPKHDTDKQLPEILRTAVAAKLSIQHDLHLSREARNYQKFPKHFFQHWNGYNLVDLLEEPTPAGAVVPQFYGYYVPEDGEAKEGEYLSPILLVEDCGTPIELHSLNADERRECVSLLFRLHREGWIHGSFWERNDLMANGRIDDWPVERSHEDRRFRLIDFGRSMHYDAKYMGDNKEFNTAWRDEMAEALLTYEIPGDLASGFSRGRR